MGAVDRATRLRNADLEALAFEQRSANLTAQGEIQEAKGEAASQAGVFDAFSGILTGGSQVAGKWYELNPPDPSTDEVLET